MIRRTLVSCALIGSLLGSTSCNEIVGARRFEVADGATRFDASGDSGPPDFDAGDCDPIDRETYYLDGDADTNGRDDSSVEACALPPGYANRGGDCDDALDTVYPGASEICDGRDNDCDATIDEGLFGPIGAPFEIVPAGSAGSVSQTAVAAYPGGYLAVSGGVARWLDAAGSPSSDVFDHLFGGVEASGDRFAAIVFPDTSPARGVIASYEQSRTWLNVRAYSANQTGTALGGITVYSAPTDPPFMDVYQMDLVRLGDGIAVLTSFTAGDDDSLLRIGLVDPTTWSAIGSFDEYGINAYNGTLAVNSVPPSALIALAVVNGISVESEMHWMTANTTGISFDPTPALARGSSTHMYLPSAPLGIGDMGDTLMVVDDTTLCLHRVSLPATGGAISLPACPGAITWEPSEMIVRQGVVSVLTGTMFQEEELVPGTGGTPPVSLGIPGGTLPRMAMRDDGGLIVFTQAGALSGLRLGCEPP